MNRTILALCLSIIFTFLLNPAAPLAETGTRIKEGAQNTPETVVWFSEPREITDIRLLLQNGKKQEALTKARDYVDKLKGVPGAEAQVRRYFGLNALCATLTSTGELKEAIASCTQAIDIFPTRWQALNNRGVAHLLSNKLDLAQQDFTLALKQVQDSEPLSDLIQHNITLVETKRSGAGQ